MPGLELLTYAFMQRAFLAGIAVAIVCPLIGVFLVLRRLSLLADGLGHVTFAGLAAGFLFGIYPLLAALVAAIVGAVGIERIRTRGRIAGDAAIAMFYTAGLALGVVLVSRAGGFNVNVLGYLFGSIAAVAPRDLLTVAILAAIVVTLIALFYKELLYLTFDEQSARAAGLPALAVNTLLAALAAITTVAAMQIVGLLLVSSLMVLPALTAIRLAKSFRGTLAIAVAAALIAVLVGLTLSFYLDSAPGGTIVLSALAVFGLASLAERRSQVTSPQVTSLFGRRTG
ncbi:MAG: metal ABC transporter permease [Thermomicrobiales bacterium]|nr:metal ABC transporter permease [Thermomicrobiales bacterium]